MRSSPQIDKCCWPRIEEIWRRGSLFEGAQQTLNFKSAVYFFLEIFLLAAAFLSFVIYPKTLLEIVNTNIEKDLKYLERPHQRQS